MVSHGYRFWTWLPSAPCTDMSRSLPIDLLPHIAEHLRNCEEHSTLASLALVSHAGAEVAAKALYSAIIIRLPDSRRQALRWPPLGPNNLGRTTLSNIVEEDEEEDGDESSSNGDIKLERVVRDLRSSSCVS
jgi:hypothetical protein